MTAGGIRGWASALAVLSLSFAMFDDQLLLFRRPPHPGGRPRTSPWVPHISRRSVARSRPHHVTLRVRRHVWNLRSQRCFQRIAHALRGVRAREGFRIVHFAVLGNHVHLLAEADDRAAMTNGVRALAIRLAKRLNKLMCTRGSLYVDRYHERVLESPSMVRNAMRYVLTNHEHHYGASRSKRDRFSSVWPACAHLVAQHGVLAPPRGLDPSAVTRDPKLEEESLRRALQRARAATAAAPASPKRPPAGTAGPLPRRRSHP